MNDVQVADYLSSKNHLINNGGLRKRVFGLAQDIMYDREKCSALGVDYNNLGVEDNSKVVCYALMTELEKEVKDNK